ncbi:MAG: hypothetical protein IPP48_11950 [Chitinophagaceae bacterium]|nr:hypothetical protein [Chitinophagaceae bacterium]
MFVAFTPVFVQAQRIGKDDLAALQKQEEVMKPTALKIIQGISSKNRFEADSLFTRQFVKALTTKNSFYYTFDSLETISRLYAPDSSFKIFTWQMMISDNVIRQHGAIQMRTYDGSLKLYPLIDKSDVTQKIADTIGNNKGWIGAIYYRIIQKKSSNKNYYTLIGYDENNIRSNKKIIEVLSFDNDEPVFGGRYFSFESDKTFKSSQSRYIMEYKKNASPRLNYDEELDMIIMEHLISESGKPNSKWTLVGDGDYEGFVWRNGKWIHVDKVFNQTTPMGKEPVPNPVRGDDGTIDEKKLKGAENDDVKPKTTIPKKKGN